MASANLEGLYENQNISIRPCNQGSLFTFMPLHGGVLVSSFSCTCACNLNVLLGNMDIIFSAIVVK